MYDWENPAVFQKNRLPTRAYAIPDEHVSLNGEWDFQYVSSPSLALEPSETADYKHFTKINVPGHWQLQGYGRPQYTNVVFPIPVDPPYVPSENPTGTYRRNFSVPEQWPQDAKIRLRFDGVDSAYYVFVDGVEVGYSQGSRNAAEFDVTDLVSKSRDQEHELFVRVLQWSDATYIEDQDQWWLSGIFRDVTLIGFHPVGHVEDFRIETVFDDKYENATVEVELKTETARDDVLVKLDLKTKYDHALVESAQVKVSAGSNTSTISIPVKAPHHWTAEDPFLYSIEMTVVDNGSVVHRISHNVGFRQVAMINGNITVNGTPILIKGVNRHEMHPQFGRAVPHDFMRRDLLLMKKHNINAVRCSHYPNHPLFYDVCDELGLWVMDEADLECHGFYDIVARPLDIPEEMDYDERKKLVFDRVAAFTSGNTQWKEAYLDRARQMVYRDRNHPSIIIWSLGNESFYGSNHVAMYDLIKSLDSHRPVHYEGDMEAKSADLFSMMYPSLDTLKKFAAKYGDNFEKPLILCEYAHAMGNGPGGMREYQDLFYKERILQGGYIWEWANHGLLKTDEKSGKEFYAYGGDFGEYPHDGTFVMDGLLNAQHNPTPGLAAYKKVIQPISCFLSGSTVTVKNLYDFISLDHLSLDWKIAEYNGFEESIKKHGSMALANIPSQQTVEIVVPEFAETQDFTGETWATLEFKLNKDTVWADHGHIIGLWQEKLGGQSKVAAPNTTRGIFAITEDKRYIVAQGKSTTLKFDKSLGKVESWVVNSKERVIPGTNSITFWRALTDNDRPFDGPYWKRFGIDKLRTSVRSVFTKHNDGFVDIESELYVAPPILGWGFKIRNVYHVFESHITIDSRITPTAQTTEGIPRNIPRVGWEFAIPSHFSKSKWFGLGPGESYSDKVDGVHVGVFEEDTDKLDFRYDVPQENGNRSQTRYFWIGSDGSGVKGSMTSKGAEHLFGFKASAVSNLTSAKHDYELVDGPLTLRIDYDQHGVGTAACGPGVLPEYVLKTREYEFSIDLVAEE